MQSLVRRLVQTVVVVLIVSLLTVSMIRFMDQEPAYAILGEHATPDQVARFNAEAGLDRPLLVQWGTWLQGWLQGDLGQSLRTREPVSSILMERLPITLELAVLALLVGLLFAIPLGIYSAYNAGGRLDRIVNGASSIAVAVPGFVLALVLVYFISYQADLLPVSGWVSFNDDPVGHVKSLVLPVITLGAIEGAVATRVLRSDMYATLREDYILAAKAQGIPIHTILWRHALRPSSLSLLTISGVSLGRLIGGTVIVETIFSLPGLGQALVQGVYASDIVVVQGLTLFMVLCVVLINFAVDALYPVVDPRVSVKSH